MLKVNEYFDGKVKSIALQTASLPATVGVMDIGDYEFGTSQREVMQVVSGTLRVKLPGPDTWQDLNERDSIERAANQKFQLEVPVQTAYLCTYG